MLDEDGDLLIRSGDLVIGDNEAVHVEDLVHSFKGEWKEFPLLGAEAVTRIKQRAGLSKLKKDIRTQLQEDGYVNVRTTLQGSDININAERP